MNDSTQNGAMMAGIGMLGTVIGLLIGWLRDRDKLRYDNELALLKQRQKECEQEHAECMEKHQESTAEIAKLHQRDNVDFLALQSQIDALKKMSH